MLAISNLCSFQNLLQEESGELRRQPEKPDHPAQKGSKEIGESVVLNANPAMGVRVWMSEKVLTEDLNLFRHAIPGIETGR